MLALAAPASAHLLARGIPLSELAASSPVAVIGRVERAARRAKRRGVDARGRGGGARKRSARAAAVRARGPSPARLRRRIARAGVPEGSAPPWVSRQTALDLVEIPERAAARDALLSAVRGYAGLRGVRDRAERIAQLKTFALGNLESASERVRHEALLDLIALAPAKPFDAADVARVAALARRPEDARDARPGARRAARGDPDPGVRARARRGAAERSEPADARGARRACSASAAARSPWPHSRAALSAIRALAVRFDRAARARADVREN